MFENIFATINILVFVVGVLALVGWAHRKGWPLNHPSIRRWGWAFMIAMILGNFAAAPIIIFLTDHRH